MSDGVHATHCCPVHGYDPAAKEPPPDPDKPSGPGRECKGGCGTLVYAPQQEWCRPCYEPHRKKLQREWAARQKAKKRAERRAR